MSVTRQSRASLLLTGVALMTVALMGAAVGVQPVLGEDEPAGGDDAATPEEHADTEDVEVTETAVYAHPVTDVPPATITGSMPPQAVCLVAPGLCPEELSPLTGTLEDGIATMQEEGQVSPVQAIPPETIAVSYFGGKDRYESALKFELPDVPEGEEVTSFQLYLPLEEPSYDLSSPGFRDAIHSVFLLIGDEDPAAFGERFAEALQSDPVDLDNDYLRMEACALTEPFEPSETPETQHRDDMPRGEPFQEGELGPPAVDCLLGGTGTLDEDGEYWVFDLTFAVDAWTTGEADNHGVLISPAGVPNLAYGEPDHTTFAQAVLGYTGATAAMSSEEPPPPIEPMGDDFAMDDAGEPADAPQTGDGFDGSPAPSAPSNGNNLQQPNVADGPDMNDEPAGGEAVDEPAVAASPETQQATPARSASPSLWIWLLVPVFAGGAFLVTRSLTAPVTAAATRGDGGAMSRLIAGRGGAALI